MKFDQDQKQLTLFHVTPNNTEKKIYNQQGIGYFGWMGF